MRSFNSAGNSASGIFYGQADVFSLPVCGYGNLSAEMAVFDCILNKIVYHPVIKMSLPTIVVSLQFPISFIFFS